MTSEAHAMRFYDNFINMSNNVKKVLRTYIMSVTNRKLVTEATQAAPRTARKILLGLNTSMFFGFYRNDASFPKVYMCFKTCRILQTSQQR